MKRGGNGNPVRGKQRWNPLRVTAGFTLAELMLTMLILVLSAGGMTSGMLFATEQYRLAKVRSEADVLAATLTDFIRDTLRNATGVDPALDGTVNSFTAPDTTGENSKITTKVWDGDAPDENGFGELWLEGGGGTKQMISSASYSEYHLRAKVEIQYCNDSSLVCPFFKVTLKIKDPLKSKTLFTSQFDVMQLNSG